jgi:hypothetical protein
MSVLEERRVVHCVWNAMAHAQKIDFVFRRNERIHLNRRGRQFCRLLAAEVCASAVVMLDTPCCEVVWRVLATHSIRQFPLHFPSPASPCAITFQLDSTYIAPWGSPACLRSPLWNWLPGTCRYRCCVASLPEEPDFVCSGSLRTTYFALQMHSAKESNWL